MKHPRAFHAANDLNESNLHRDAPENVVVHDTNLDDGSTYRGRREDLLMEHFYEGDDEAFEDLYLFFAPRLNSLAIKLLPAFLPARRELAEDFVNEVFGKAAATRERGSGRWIPSRGGVGGWLKGILRKQIISYLRTKKGKEQTSTDVSAANQEGEIQSLENQAESPVPEPACWLAALQRKEQVQKAMIELSPQERQVLQLRFWRQQRYREISRLTGLSIPTVSRRIQSAQNTLRNLLEDGELTFDDLPPDLPA